MKKENVLFLVKYLCIILLGIVADQLSKSLMEQLLQNGNTVPILGNWLELQWTINTGSSFGLLKGQNVLFFMITCLGVPFFGFMLARARKRSWWSRLGYAFILAGTLGNAVDRAILGDGFFNGGVRDFISVQGFAIFNVADSFLTVGVALAILGLLFFDFDAVFSKENAKENNAN